MISFSYFLSFFLFCFVCSSLSLSLPFPLCVSNSILIPFLIPILFDYSSYFSFSLSFPNCVSISLILSFYFSIFHSHHLIINCVFSTKSFRPIPKPSNVKSPIAARTRLDLAHTIRWVCTFHISLQKKKKVRIFFAQLCKNPLPDT